jgi:cell division protein FtsQ
VSGAPGPRTAERRRQLRQQRRQERLKNLWRILVLGGSAAGLGWLLLREGWVVAGPGQVEVVGSRQVSREQVIREGQLRFPLPLLGLSPQQLRSQLAAALPVERVQVSRLMLPPRLRIELTDREAVAQAQRRTGKGQELGYVDRLGHWMSSRQQRSGSATTAPQVRVIGWQERLRQPLALVLAKRDQLGSRLEEVRFEPNGSLGLRTAALGTVHLGPPDERLPRRLEVLQHLSERLPQQLQRLKVQSIDLSDPEKPELGLPGQKAAPVASAQRSAGGPTGGRGRD